MMNTINNRLLFTTALLLTSITCCADKHLFQITDIVNSDHIIVNGEVVRADSIISENYVWTWDDANDVIVFFTPLDGDDVGSIYTTSKKEMTEHSANSLSYLNFAGKGIHELYDVFILQPGKKAKLPIRAKEMTTYYVDKDNKKQLMIEDTIVYMPYDLIQTNDSKIVRLDTIKVYSSYYDIDNDNYEENIEGIFVFYKK